jgi:hypothetical protein
LRGMCLARAIDLLTADGKRKTTEPMNHDLRKATPPAYDVYVAKRVTSWGDLRNRAAHGEAVDESETKGFIAEITKFCGDHR